MTWPAFAGATQIREAAGPNSKVGDPLVLWPSSLRLGFDEPFKPSDYPVRSTSTLARTPAHLGEATPSTLGTGSTSIQSISRWGPSSNDISENDDFEADLPLQLGRLRIKNTFIDGVEGEYSQKLGIQSCPVVRLQQAQRAPMRVTPSVMAPSAAMRPIGLPERAFMPGPLPASPTQTASPVSMGFGACWPSQVLPPQPAKVWIEAQAPRLPLSYPPLNSTMAFLDQPTIVHRAMSTPIPGSYVTHAEASGEASKVLTRQPQPSFGSSLHGTGQCKPCAWYWKPEGCKNGEKCCHCHLCPEGELKARKKERVAAMRMGALEPVAPGVANGAARTLKITPLLTVQQ